MVADNDPFADDAKNRDPAQTAPPDVDTSMKLDVFGLIELRFDRVVMFAGPLVLLFVGVLIFLFTGSGILTAVIAIGATAMIAAAAFAVVITGAHDKPVERLGRWFEARSLRKEGVWSHEDLIEEAIHGVENVLDDGAIEMDEGRMVALYRLQGTNTAKLDRSELNNMSAALSRGFDEHVHPGEESDAEVGFYSATFGNSAEDAASSLEQAAKAPRNRGGEKAAARELLYSTAEWLRNENDEVWRDAGWRHYIVAEVLEDEVARGDVEGFDSGGFLWTVKDLVLSAVGRSEAAKDYSELRREAMHELLNRRIEQQIVPAVTQANLTGERTGPEETGMVLSRYYSAGQNKSNGEPALEPGGVDPSHTTFLRTDDRYSRAFWIADWPPDAQSMFLREIYTMNDIDADIRLRYKPEESSSVVNDLEHVAGDISAEGEDRGERSELAKSDLEEDVDYYIRMRRILRRSPVKPWRLSGYVVVHADTEDALSEIEDSIRGIDDLDVAALRALEESGDRVKQAFESHPAETRLFYASDAQAHLDVWRSASPVEPDRWAARTEGRTVSEKAQFKREVVCNPRKRLVLGGMIGAAFPPCAGRIDEPGGIVWGRNQQNGSLVRASPFERGEAPHMITLGKSRSGKTYSTTQGAIRWYEETEDATLILCDTQNGFHGATQLLDGVEIPIGGKRGINPFDIQPVSDEIRDSIGDQIDPLGLKISGVTSFIVSLAESMGGDPGDFYPVVDRAVQQVYRDAGITQDLDTHSRESPSFGDFIDAVNELFDVEPDESSRWNRPEVVEERKDMATELLTRLSALQEGGEYAYLMSESDMGLNDPDVDMAYLNLHQIRKQDDLDTSAMLMLMLDQVSEKIKRAPGRTKFVIDEAHALLHSEKTVSWINKAVREWARYDASMHFVSQSPSEFIQGTETETEDEKENKKRPIIEQSSIIRLFNMPKTPPSVLQSLGGGDTEHTTLNDTQIETVRGGLVPGEMNLGYSECLTAFEDREGWWPVRVESSPFEHHVLNYKPSKHGNFTDYIRPWVAGDSSIDGRPSSHGTPDEGDDDRDGYGDGSGVPDSRRTDRSEVVADGQGDPASMIETYVDEVSDR